MLDNHDIYNPYIPDYTKPGKEMLIDLINWANRKTMTKVLTPENVWFTRPVKNPRESDCNTSIRIQAVTGYNQQEHPTPIEYNRLDIRQVMSKLGFEGYLEIEDITQLKYTTDLLKVLLKTVNIGLTIDDIEFEYIDTDTLLPQFKQSVDDENYVKIDLNISEYSIAYYGKLTIELRPKNISLDTAIREVRFPYSFNQWHRNGLS